MMCQYVAFRLQMGPSIPKADVVSNLLSLNDKSKERANRVRFFKVGMLGDYIVGRWGSLQGRSKHVIADKETKEMIWDEVPDGFEVTAPNYFVLHTRTFHGLYQRYRNSNAFRHFLEMLRSVTAEVSSPLIRDAMKEPRAIANKGRKRGDPRRPVPAQVKNDIYERHAVNCFPLLRKETLEQLLTRWRSIKAIRFQVATVQPSYDNYGPLAEHTKAEVRELRLDAKTDGGGRLTAGIVKMREWLTSQFKSRLRKTSLIGVDERSKSKTVSIDKYTDHLGEDDVDSILTDKELDTKNVVESPLLAKMVALCASRPEYFEKVAV